MERLTVLDPRFEKRALLAADDREFSARMEEVDAQLKVRDIPIFARPLQSVPLVCQRGGFSLGLHEPLAERMKSWFDARYEERLKVDLSLGYGPVLIRGDLFRMCSPLLMFGGRVVCISGEVKPFGAVPIVNVLDHIDWLSDQLASILSTNELWALQQQFIEREKLFPALRNVQYDDLFKIAFGDLNSAVDFLFQERPQVGQARWACLQAVEKFLKGWIRKKGGTVPTGRHGHDLGALHTLASTLSLSGLDAADIAFVQCSAGVRYGEAAVTNEEVVAGFNAALHMCAFIATEVRASEVRSKPTLQRADTKALTRERFLSLKIGDILMSGSFQLTIAGVAQNSPRWYRTLAFGATNETVIVEGDLGSFALVKQGQISVD